MDRLSRLPKPILHDIMSRLPEKDVARTSVLSKAWNDIWATFPILSFDASRCPMPEDQENPQQVELWALEMYNFLICVDSTLVRFHNNGLAVKKFKLVMKIFNFLFSRIDHYLMLACETGVEELHLEFQGYSECLNNFYCLPSSVLEAKSLIQLKLSGAIRVDEAFLNYPIKFSLLQVLSLRQLYLENEQVIQNIISSCPLIEDITLRSCFDLKSLRIHGLPKLKQVDVEGIEDVDIDAPSLENLLCESENPDAPCKISIDKCRNLRNLCLVYVSSIIICKQWLVELFQKSPLLERLFVQGCNTSERIKISSLKLKFLEFMFCSKLKEAEIDAPNLSLFGYFGDGSTMPVLSFLNCSTPLECNVIFSNVDCLVDLYKLREFLQSIKPRDILGTLCLGIRNATVVFDPDALQGLSIPPPRVNHLQLVVYPETEAICLPLVTGLFWTCRPILISLLVAKCSHTFIKLFCENIMIRKEEECCCNWSQLNCWWHSLKKFEVTSTCREFENVAVDCEILLEALPTLSPEGKDKITFRFEWLDQSNE